MASKGALRAGLSWAEFWASTPYQTRCVVEAWSENRKLDRNVMIAAGYINAQLGNVDPRKFPTLEQILGEKKKVVDQTPKEFSASFLQWAIAHGLEVEEDSSDT